MSILIDETTIALWYVPIEDGNWVAVLNETASGIELDCRFRRYVDDKVTGSQDEMKHLRAQMPSADAQAVIKQVREMAKDIAQSSPALPNDPSHRVELLRGAQSLEGFMARVQQLPFFHTRTAAVQPARHA